MIQKFGYRIKSYVDEVKNFLICQEESTVIKLKNGVLF